MLGSLCGSCVVQLAALLGGLLPGFVWCSWWPGWDVTGQGRGTTASSAPRAKLA
ncbi:hypothetical protein [Actinomyces graevenitzii]|uniref:hypothetical protein n=1 Tax=Actinomyces graevenitzii TaxID=55565 RepID=UPI0015E13B10|nr:hypothetical protein [Actinomyces graevenitzii]